MDYQFPKIEHINDVLPAIKDSNEFIVAQKDGYQIINYVVAYDDTFPSINTVGLACGDCEHIGIFETTADYYAALRRECRGLIFDMEGNLINRRYHKFFNVNEREETAINQINWNNPHKILEKLDGSMVSPCSVNGYIRWMTKMGITDTSMEAESFVAQNPKYTNMAKEMLDLGYTPIFEWCSNKNRIVLDYPEDNLILTAVRNIITGEYLTQLNLLKLGDQYNIPVVKSYDIPKAGTELMEIIRNTENTEGVVVRFDNGHMIKIKSDWYVRIHKIKSLLGQERDLVALILNNELDDLLPILPTDDVSKIKKFQTELMDNIKNYSERLIVDTIHYRTNFDRKTFALTTATELDPLWRSLIFKFWENDSIQELSYQAIVDIILKNSSNNQSYAKVKEAFLKDVNYQT